MNHSSSPAVLPAESCCCAGTPNAANTVPNTIVENRCNDLLLIGFASPLRLDPGGRGPDAKDGNPLSKTQPSLLRWIVKHSRHVLPEDAGVQAAANDQ